ncbi:MAG: RNA methyltransferase [Muribaculaceae bacterium]|nr:RNA methyltransferase [Muribaculaceae bacterium]
MSENFEMVAKTFQGLEGVLADELTALGAQNVTQGRRMVAFSGNLEMLYRANFCLRTALRVLKPIYKFRSVDADDLYEQVKQFDWDSVLHPDKTFSIDSTVYSETFRHSRFVTYRVKDAIADYFREKYNRRPSIRLNSPDIKLDVHISQDEVTISLDSSGAPLYKRGWREAQTDAPINEVLAAGIILLSGWRGESDLIDPMCGSGTFLIEAALIAANINPGVYRNDYAFQQWPDYDRQLFEEIYNDDSGEREFKHKIYGYDIEGKAIAISRANIKRAGLTKMIEVERKDIQDLDQAPENGILITNPPYGERLHPENIADLYRTLGEKLKRVFTGYHAWIIAPNNDITDHIGLRPSISYPLYNGDIECALKEYVMFKGSYNEMRRAGGHIKNETFRRSDEPRRPRYSSFGKGEGDRRPPFKKGDDRDRRHDERRFGKDRMHERRDRQEGDNSRPGDLKEREDFFHSPDFARQVIKFREPTLGKDSERPIVKGRRNGWRRKGLDENGGGNTPEPTGEK